MGTVSTETLDTLNKTPIYKDEMLRYLTSLNCSDSPPSFKKGLNVAMQVFDKNSNKCFSLNIRLEALNRILSEGNLPGWINDGGEDGSFYIAENVYFAAGIAPLHADGDRYSFDRDALLKAAFQLGKIDT